MSAVIPTVDELVNTLKHSTLPTVLVEGPDDMFVYRRFEQILGPLRADFQACGGRENLLAMFRRRTEFAHLPVCFVADRDSWIFTGVPAEFADVTFTSGYSIENDLYYDSDIERILNSDERANYDTVISSISRWFAFEVNELLNGREWQPDPNLHLLLPLRTFTCCPNFLTKRNFVEPPPQLREEIRTNYKLRFRGKLLFDLLVRFTHERGRWCKYPRAALIEMAVVYSDKGKLTNDLIQRIAQVLAVPPATSQFDLFSASPA